MRWDQRATAVLTAGYAQLQRYADQITNATLRRSFWDAVPVHRELQQIYMAM